MRTTGGNIEVTISQGQLEVERIKMGREKGGNEIKNSRNDAHSSKGDKRERKQKGMQQGYEERKDGDSSSNYNSNYNSNSGIAGKGRVPLRLTK